MSAVLKGLAIRLPSDAGSKMAWCDCAPGIQAKTLAIDAANNTVECLIRLAPGYKSERHTHICETYAYVLEGTLINHTTGCEFNPGDLCYQPHNDEHVEEAGPEGLTAYVSYRGRTSDLVEFYDESGAVCGTFTVQDFADLLA